MLVKAKRLSTRKTGNLGLPACFSSFFCDGPSPGTAGKKNHPSSILCVCVWGGGGGGRTPHEKKEGGTDPERKKGRRYACNGFYPFFSMRKRKQK